MDYRRLTLWCWMIFRTANCSATGRIPLVACNSPFDEGCLKAVAFFIRNELPDYDDFIVPADYPNANYPRWWNHQLHTTFSRSFADTTRRTITTPCACRSVITGIIQPWVARGCPSLRDFHLSKIASYRCSCNFIHCNSGWSPSPVTSRAVPKPSSGLCAQRRSSTPVILTPANMVWRSNPRAAMIAPNGYARRSKPRWQPLRYSNARISVNWTGIATYTTIAIARAELSLMLLRHADW